MAEARFEIDPYDFAAASRLSDALGVSHTLAQILVRRGLADVGAARAFLDADVRHPLSAFGGLAEAAEIVLGHVRAGSRITVHGDYDVDGVCSTAILVRVLRTLGAGVDWYLPSRTEDGYGLAAATVDRLAARGTKLLITADCAITAVDEVQRAIDLGMDVVVTDHHAPRADGRLPAAPIVHPRQGGEAVPAPPPAEPGPRAISVRGIRAGTCARRGSPGSSRARCWPPRATTRRWPTRTSTWSRWPPSPTWSRSTTRTARSCGPGCARCARRASRGCGR